jgi:hypothetical protein
VRPEYAVIDRLAASSPSDRLAKALTMRGRVVKTTYFLRYLHDDALRDRVHLQLNRGESRHEFARRLFAFNQGAFRSGDYEELMNKVSALSVLSNAVLVWNTFRITNVARDFVAHKKRYGIIGRRSRLPRGSRYGYLLSRTAAVLAGVLVALKQHFILYLPALALVPGFGFTGALLALGVAVATYLPFVLATPSGLFVAVVLHHLENPSREDSLSVAATLARFGVRLPSWVGMVASLATFGALPRVPRTVGALLLSSSLTFLAFYVFGRQAFCNYYYLLDATVLVAAAALTEA